MCGDGRGLFLSPGGLGSCWADVILEGWRKCGRGCLPALAFPGPGDHPRLEHGGDWVVDARVNGGVPAFSRPCGQVRQKVKARERMEGIKRDGKMACQHFFFLEQHK